MSRGRGVLAALAILALAVAHGALAANVGDRAPAVRAARWINADPAPAADLAGAVTLVEFWTFACANCRNVEPHVKGWHERFSSRGLRVIGVHSPELRFEREIENVRRYIRENEITWPVAIDNDYAIWDAFGNRAWPTWYVIDRAGKIRYVRVGEGGYAETEAAIERLLEER